MPNNAKEWETLQQKIQSQLGALPVKSILRHHMGQFDIFSTRLRTWLPAHQDIDEKTILMQLKELWKRFEEVAVQYDPANPYYKIDKEKTLPLETFQQQAACYYQRLSRVLSLDPMPSHSAPIFYFSCPSKRSPKIAELLLFKATLPSLIDIPLLNRKEWFCPNDAKIAYQTARVFFEHIPGVISEMQQWIQTKLPDLPPLVVAWSADILARMTGFALAYKPPIHEELPKNAPAPILKNATIKTPAALILPAIAAKALTYLVQHSQLKYEQAANDRGLELITKISDKTEKLLKKHQNKLYTFAPNTPPIKLQTMSDGILNVVDLLLSTDDTFKTLGDRSFKDVLRACSEDTSEKFELVEWGQITDAEMTSLVTPVPILLPLSCRSEISPAGLGLIADFLNYLFG